MAYGEIGSLMPRDSSFTSQAGYLEAAKAEGIKRANYLSQMDSFYAELEESTREFDLKLGLDREQFSESTRQFDERLEWDKEYGTGMLENQSRELGLRSQQMSDNYSLGRSELALKSEMFDHTRENDALDRDAETDIMRTMLPLRLENMGLVNEAWRIKNSGGKDTGAGQLNLNTYATNSNVYNPFSDDSIRDFLAQGD